MQHANGAWLWVNERSEGVYDENGAVLAIEGFIADISERMKLTLKARTHIELLEKLSALGLLLSGDPCRYLVRPFNYRQLFAVGSLPVGGRWPQLRFRAVYVKGTYRTTRVVARFSLRRHRPRVERLPNV